MADEENKTPEPSKADINLHLNAIVKKGKRSYKLPAEEEKKLNPWDRQRGETHSQFKAFLLWRDIPTVDRSQTELARQLGHSNTTTISRWSNQWDWEGRSIAYDNYLQNLELKDREKRIIDMNERHITLAYAVQVQLARALEEMDFKKLTPKDIKELLLASVEIERRAFDLDGNKANVQITQNTFKQVIHKATNSDEEANRLTSIIDTLREVGALDDKERKEPKSIEAEYKLVKE